ncbi:MAG: cytochrome c [Gammaproteobacteria bacterium]
MLKLVLAGGVLALSSVAQAEGDAAAGKYAFTTCSGCHAIAGYTNAYPTYHVPRLGGQRADYIAAALKAYKADERDHLTMHANAANLNDADMQNIGAFLSGFEVTDDTPPVHGDAAAGEKKAAEIGCAACHGEGGKAPQPTMPVLAGQFEDYLVKALQDYRAGTRKQIIMQSQAQNLSDEDIANLAAYYASQSPGLAVIEFHGGQ